MNRPNPIAAARTLADKVAALKTGHAFGYRWESNIEQSLDSLSKWSEGDIDENTHVVMISTTGKYRGRYIQWLRPERAAEFAGLPKTHEYNNGYTLVNSLDHLRDYLQSLKR